ncbi:MAG: hypothetical protein RLZZ369_1135, partial [Pseudomonadota bacterium]
MRIIACIYVTLAAPSKGPRRLVGHSTLADESNGEQVATACSSQTC